MKTFLHFACILMVTTVISCKKNSFITSSDANLGISADTLHFDTVFTSIGSVTQLLKIFNNNDRKLRLSNVRLGGGTGSYFKMNVDGTPADEVSNIEIEANDSLYVFVTVKIDPDNSRLPFVVEDSIGIDYNGNTRWVQLQAFGQNAIFLRSKVISGSEIWESHLPYVIIGGILIDKNATLTVEKGTRIFFHADAPMIVDGSLLVNGGKEDSSRVSFQADRLDEPYSDFPGGWPGIYLREASHDNRIDYAAIRNAYQGIVTEGPQSVAGSKLTISQSIIDNCYDAGILSLASSITAENCLISNCGKGIQLVYGGNYTFTHCTATSYSNDYGIHKDPVLLITDYIKVDDVAHTADINALFTNCIFWGEDGTVENEVISDRQGNNNFNVSFYNSLWKIKDEPSGVNASGMISNEDPEFKSINTGEHVYDFRLQQSSPAIDKGKITGLNIDLDGLERNPVLPDIGCYEWR